jgi:peptidoglycan hydrolase FlgJ
MSIDVARTHLTVDPRGLDAIRRDVRVGDDSPETIRAVAKQFESLFARMLIKSMRETSFGGGLMDSEQSEFYRDMFDQQLSVELTEGRGLGLADLLVRQLSQAGAAGGAGPAAPGVGASSTPAGATGETTTPVQPGPTGVTAAGRGTFGVQSREDFVRQVWPHAEAAGRALGVDPATIVSHAALETGWGRSLPKQTGGETSYNLFGIKAGRGWAGASAPASTLEFREARAVRGVENFRAYDSLGAGVADYARLLGNSPRYALALNTGSNVAAFAGALQRAGYATDPHYATKLQAVAAQVQSLLGSPGALKVADSRPSTPAGMNHG